MAKSKEEIILNVMRHQKYFTFKKKNNKRSRQITCWCFNIFLSSKLQKFCHALLKSIILHQNLPMDYQTNPVF